jgi:hypothetical protein
VPLMIALHIICLVTLARAARPAPPAADPVMPGATPRAAMAPSAAPQPR